MAAAIAVKPDTAAAVQPVSPCTQCGPQAQAASGSGSDDVHRIRKLDQAVVNRIAAGEVVVRAASALKEMLENSLDAGSTSIAVTAANGGMQLLQVQDNGHGIAKEDFPLVCERFATSKLKSFEDLNSIATYGFRGEALASISYVSHVTVTSMTPGAPCAFRALFENGLMVPAKPGASAGPTPCAGVPGTSIVVEDMFYNVPIRRRALGSATEEYAKLLDVVSRYAIHYGSRGVAFSCKKHGSAATDLRTVSDASVLENIRVVYGRNVGRELQQLELTIPLDDDNNTCKIDGYLSNANYSMKKGVFICFINHRLVDCTTLRKAIEQVYADILPKGSHPFIYVSLELPANQVDVNVHPTKREVHFLCHDTVVEAVTTAVHKMLANANASRTFYSQTFLPVPDVAGFESSAGDIASSSDSAGLPPATNDVAEVEPTPAPAQRAAPKLAPNRVVRADHASMTLDSFVNVQATQAKPTVAAAPSPATLPESGDSEFESPMLPTAPYVPPEPAAAAVTVPAEEVDAENDDPVVVATPVADAIPQVGATRGIRRKYRKYADETVLLTSVAELRDECRVAQHHGLLAAFRHHVFVGVVNDEWSLMQHDTKLLLVNHSACFREYLYQAVLDGFGHFELMRLSSAVPIADAAALALQPHQADVAAAVASTMIERRDMLAEYFGIQVDADGHLVALPILLEGYTPQLAALPEFLVACHQSVIWAAEKPCFSTFARALAAFYASLPSMPPAAQALNDPSAAGWDPAHQALDQERVKKSSLFYILEHLVFPALRSDFTPGTKLSDSRMVVQVAATEQLYRIFERC